jgi:glutaredoxin-related protein
MDTPQITAYLKTYCGWSAGVRAVFAKYNLQYTEKDIIQNPAFRWEMETKSGQPLSPCVEINGHMLGSRGLDHFNLVTPLTFLTLQR